MNTVVNKLLDVDKQARVILDEAQKYYDKTIADIEIEKQKITAEYEEKAKNHCEKAEISERDAVTDASKEIEARYAGLTLEMDKAFEAGRIEWENELFSRCVGIVK